MTGAVFGDGTRPPQINVPVINQTLRLASMVFLILAKVMLVSD